MGCIKTLFAASYVKFYCSIRALSERVTDLFETPLWEGCIHKWILFACIVQYLAFVKTTALPEQIHLKEVDGVHWDFVCMYSFIVVSSSCKNNKERYQIYLKHLCGGVGGEDFVCISLYSTVQTKEK